MTSCTAAKAAHDDHPLIRQDFRDPDRLRRRDAELHDKRMAAGEMYTGGQAREVRRGIELLRGQLGHDAVTLKIVSAGYGLIDEARVIVPYNVTFTGMDQRKLRQWATHRGIPTAVRKALRGFPLVIVLLGARYLRAIEPPLVASPGQRLVFLVARSEAARVGGQGVTVVPAGTKESRAYGAPNVTLKGTMFRLFACGLIARPAKVWNGVLRDDSPTSFCSAVTAGRARS